MLTKTFLKLPVFFRKIILTAGLIYRNFKRGQILKNNEGEFVHNFNKNITNTMQKSKRVTTKEDIRKRDVPTNKERLVKGQTSGSTGEPLVYYRSKESLEHEYDIYDQLYRFPVKDKKFRVARISGVPISSSDDSSCVGMYLPFVRRLQMSAHHINSTNIEKYYKLLSTYKPKLGTGYATSWYDLAVEFHKKDINYYDFDAIVTDSSGLSIEQQKFVEDVFNTKVIQTYGLSEVGMVAVQCENHNYHILSRVQCSVLEDGQVKNEGYGEILITDLLSKDYPYINYATGDIGLLKRNNCNCSFASDTVITELEGRTDDYIELLDGTRLRGGLTRIFSDLTDVYKAQIIQKKDGYIQIVLDCKKTANIENITKTVRKRSEQYFSGMKVDIDTNGAFKYTSRGKFRFIIREV